MSAVASWLRAELRARWRSWIVLTVLVGFLGGVALTAATGARRTDTALARLVAYSHTAGVNIGTVYPGLASLPEVAAVDELVGEPLLWVLPDGRVDPRFPLPVASVDGRVLYEALRPVIRAGRLPLPGREDEAMATVEAAKQDHLRVGSRITLRDMSRLIGPNKTAILRRTAYVAPDQGTPVEITIVGIGVDYTDVAAASARSQGGQGAFGTIYLTPAYAAAHGGAGAGVYTGALLELRPGTDLGRLRRDIDVLAARHPVAPGGSSYDLSDLGEQFAALQRAMHPDAVALWLFAALVGLASALVVGQALSRQAWEAVDDFTVLRSLGFTRGEFLLAATTPTAVIALGGGLIAVAAAVLASPLTPVGPARLAEPHPGVAVNVAVLGMGLGLIVVLVLAQVIVSTWSAIRRAGVDTTGHTRPSRIVDVAARAGLPAPAVAGLRLALEPGRGRNAVPVRNTLTGAVLAVAAVIVALTFNTNLGRLNSTPARYGWSWDLAVDGGYFPLPAGQVRGVLAGLPEVAALAGGNYASVIVNGRLVPAVGLDQLDGSVFPTLLDGRAPQSGSEIAFGARTLRQARASVGGMVDVQVGDVARRLQVSGRAIFPDFERGGFTATDLGVGAAATSQLLHPTGIPPGVTYNFFLVRYANGTQGAAATAAIRQALAPLCAGGACSFFLDRRPNEVNAYGQVKWTPLLLAGVLALLAAAALGNALVSSVRRRRRDLAVLKTLGFTRGQVSTAVMWQATALVAAALLAGLPVGAAAGRLLWSAFARQLGVATDALTPLVAVLVAIPVTVVIGNIMAAVPAWTAGRVQPSRVLREE
jgi:ABC-type lipoprotein release transport system permease subunit